MIRVQKCLKKLKYPLAEKEVDAFIAGYFPNAYPLLGEFEARVAMQPFKMAFDEKDNTKFAALISEGISLPALQLFTKALVETEDKDLSPAQVRIKNSVLGALKAFEVATGKSSMAMPVLLGLLDLVEPETKIDGLLLSQHAGKREDYALAARIRDKLRERTGRE